MSVTYTRDKDGNLVPLKSIRGYTPVKGVDYWTNADQNAIIQQVIDALGGTPVFGTVDANNNIILSGNLTEGVYTFKYEDESGKVVTIGTLTHDGKDEPTYTNQIPISTDTDGSVFNGTGYKSGYRLNSSGAVAEYTAYPMVVSGFIPCKAGDIIRLQNITWQSGVDSQNNQRIACYDANKTYLNQSNVGVFSGLSNTIMDENGIVSQFSMVPDGESFNPTNAAFIRISATYIGDDSILTVNEEIV